MSRIRAGRNVARPGVAGHASNQSTDLTSQDIITTHARTSFSFAARFLPQPQRDDAIDLYAFFRTLDDLVDESPRTDATAIGVELNDWQTWLNGNRRQEGPREPLASNLARVIDCYDIPVDAFLQMIEGLRSDLSPRQVDTDAELRVYCYQVASTVGCAMAHVLGATSPHALTAAEKLGAAMQLTNILRDVGEDIHAGRSYLPSDLLARHGLCHDDLRAMLRDREGPDDRFRDLMRDQVQRAHVWYAEAMPGIWLLPGNCQLPILVAARLYRRLLVIIEQNDYDTLRRRASTTRLDKTREAMVCWTSVSLRRVGPWTAPEHAAPTPHGSTVEAQGD